MAGPPLRIPSLDGFRAVSILLVFLAHAGVPGIPGGLGVTVFFFISGYLITTLLRREWEATGTVALKGFFLRRFFRILPPFYLVLGVVVALGSLGVIPGGVRPSIVAAQALHVSNYWIVRHGYDGLLAGTGVYWSLAVEEHFYLVFPFAFLALQRGLRTSQARAAALVLVCLATLLWRLALVAQGASEDRTYLATDTRLDSILWGAVLALQWNPALDPWPAALERVLRPVLVPAALLVLGFCLVWRDPAFRESLRYTLQGMALLPVVAAAVHRPGRLFGWANRPGVVRLGQLSYPFYLVHHIVLESLPGMGAVLRGALALVLSLGLAQVIHVAVEQPVQRWRARAKP